MKYSGNVAVGDCSIPDVIEQIAANGYGSIPQLFSGSQIDQALSLVAKWKKLLEGQVSKNVPYLNTNQPMVYNLQNKDYYFLELLFSSSAVEQVLMHFLNDRWYKQIPSENPNYILRSYLARSSAGALPLHIDSFIPYIGEYPIVMQCAIVLEDMNESNGCTLVIPGSHQSGKYVEQSAIEDAVTLTAKAGDVIFWDSRLWHGASANTTDNTRWVAIATFTRWWVKQAFDITRNLPDEIYQKLSDKERAVLGFCSVPHIDEMAGIDAKAGYEVLPTTGR